MKSRGGPGVQAHQPSTRSPRRDPCTLTQTDTAPEGFKGDLTALHDEVTALRRPLACVHGDSHYFRVDKPFQDADGRRLESFTRIETVGNNATNGNKDVQRVQVNADTKSREVFFFQAMIVPGNRVAVPAP